MDWRVTLLSVSGLVDQGIQSVWDHYTYVPLIGLFVALTVVGLLAARTNLAVLYARQDRMEMLGLGR
jgi:hypothetical protein